MALMSDVDLPVGHVRDQIAGALDLVVHMARLSDGRRGVSRISAIEGLRAGSVVVDDVFVWKRRPTPGFAATGIMPSLLSLLHERDERVDPRIFRTSVGEPDPPPQDISADRSAGGPPQIGTWKPVRRVPVGVGPRSPRHWPGRLRRFGTITE